MNFLWFLMRFKISTNAGLYRGSCDQHFFMSFVYEVWKIWFNDGLLFWETKIVNRNKFLYWYGTKFIIISYAMIPYENNSIEISLFEKTLEGF